MRRSVSLLFPVLLVGFVLGACGDPTEGKFGQELFEVACARCHGTDGAGGGAVPAIGGDSEAAALSDEQIAGIIRDGPRGMPSFGDRLSDGQIGTVVDHIRRLQGAG